jgi:hypothetical protein
MAQWNDAWYNGQLMPPHKFPRALLAVAEDIAEEWLFDARFRCMLEEWISRPEAEEVMSGLLWSGFCLRGQPDKRIDPIPVLLRLLYTEPYPVDESDTKDIIETLCLQAVREWISAVQRYQHSLRVAP